MLFTIDQVINFGACLPGISAVVMIISASELHTRIASASAFLYSATAAASRFVPFTLPKMSSLSGRLMTGTCRKKPPAASTYEIQQQMYQCISISDKI
jgi:hypothetical protein